MREGSLKLSEHVPYCIKTFFFFNLIACNWAWLEPNSTNLTLSVGAVYTFSVSVDDHLAVDDMVTWKSDSVSTGFELILFQALHATPLRLENIYCPARRKSSSEGIF